MQNGQKRTQRERLLSGMVAAANHEGYAATTVAAVIAEAGVSRKTFYQYFSDRDNCFVATTVEVQKQLLSQIRARVHGDPPEQALQATIRATMDFVTSEPAMSRFLMNEPLAGGAMAFDARDQGLVAIERLVQQRYKDAEPTARVADFSSRMIVGGIYRLLAPRLRRGEPKLGALLPDLLHWIDAYERPLNRHRWRSLKAVDRPPRSRFVPETPLRAPDPLPLGRLRMSGDEIADNQRRRIMFAAARLAEEKGYNATTIGDIIKAAGVDGRVLYEMFADKQDAFMAVHELGFQAVMAVTAEAFFSGPTWPERNWEAGLAFTQFLEDNPLVANVGFIEAYAVGPAAVQRVEDSRSAFAMLLQEGYQYVPEGERRSRLVLEGIITTIFEIVYARVRAGRGARLSGLVPHFTFLVLSPFVGPEEADAFVDAKLAKQ